MIATASPLLYGALVYGCPFPVVAWLNPLKDYGDRGDAYPELSS